MTALARPWENAVESSSSSPITVGSGALADQSSACGVGSSSLSSNALTTTASTALAGQTSTDIPQQGVLTNGARNLSNRYVADYCSGTGYGGLGMGGMYGGLGMGGMYGGLGMGGMYGGLGMGGMYGGLGMGGMYGGLGMGMSEDFQRSQMTFMLVGRLIEMCGMFSGVLQTTFGSALQFMANYIGMSQQYNQLKSGMYMDESGKWVQVPKRKPTDSDSFHRSRRQKSIKGKNEGSLWVALLRRLVFLLFSVLMAKRLTKLTATR